MWSWIVVRQARWVRKWVGSTIGGGNLMMMVVVVVAAQHHMWRRRRLPITAT